MRELHKYVELFIEACSHYHYEEDANGEFHLTKDQQKRVERFIRMKWRIA